MLLIRSVVNLFVFFHLFLKAYSVNQDDIKVVFEEELSEHLLDYVEQYHTCVPNQFKDYDLNVKTHNLSTFLPNIYGIHLNETYFSIDYEGQEYILDLALNHVLIPDYFSISSLDYNGRPEIHKPKLHEMNHCYYQGQVRGIENSQVVLSTCEGLRGIIFLPNDTLIIEPLATKRHWGSLHKHALYRANEMKQTSPVAKCANHHHSASAMEMIKDLKLYSESLSLQRIKRASPGERRFVELIIVADHAEAKFHKDRIALVNRIKEIVNFVDGFYQSLHIRVVLSHVEIWNQTNLISNSTNPIQILNEFLAFCNKRKSTNGPDSPWARADNFHLLYGRDFDGITVGMANVKAMCGDRSGGVNQDGGRSAFNTAAILAHEMGHNFGMNHDTSDCSCDEGTGCLMASTLSYSDKRSWSDCSKRYLQQNFEFGLGGCLLNVPSPGTIFGGQQCGNDIVEEGEECDCGIPDLCQSKCCDPHTCKLKPDAQCDVGLCCGDCKFKKSGSVCRASTGECDLPEYCSGIGPHCPGNVYRLDGSPCSGSTASCFDSVCLTLEKQCKAVWGEDASVGVDSCFTEVNELGDQNGNCGRDPSGGFRKCTPENAKCGKLVCQTPNRNDRPVIGRTRQSFINTVSVNNKIHICKTISSVSSDNDVTDVGLVRTGTKCGIGKTCEEGWCNATAQISCDQKCNDRGICNNLFNCHCDRGWAPPYCKGRGNGGSWDSGPVDPSNVDEPVVLLIVLSAVVLPLVLALGTFVWYRYCGGKIRMGVWKKNRQRRLEAVALSKGKTPKNTKTKSKSQENLFDDVWPPSAPDVYATSSTYKENPHVTTTVSSPPRRPPPPQPLNVRSAPKSFPIAKSVPTRKAPPPPAASRTRYMELSNPPTSSPNSRRPPPRPSLPPSVQSSQSNTSHASNNVSTVPVKERMRQFNWT